jgi:hypothetical protein
LTSHPQTVFPNDDYPSRGTLTAGAGTTREEIVSVFNRGQPIPETFDLTIAGCFDYTFSTDQKNHHQTSFRRTLLRRISVVAAITLPPFDYMLDMGNIAADDLEMVGDIGSAD